MKCEARHNSEIIIRTGKKKKNLPSTLKQYLSRGISTSERK